MIIWNKVTWYSKFAAIIFFLGVVPALTFYIGIQYEKTSEVLSIPVVSDLHSKYDQEKSGEYGYRCGDGTEFTISPSLDMSVLYITPATSVEKIKKVILTQTESKTGVRYQGSGVVFLGQGEKVKLTIGTSTTVCNPMLNDNMAPINFGD